MRAGVIQEGPLAGVRKGTVTRGFRATLKNPDYEPCWVAGHDCGWVEGLDEWHNAFWAADHHVRYDCGRREQPSSGKYAVPRGYESDPCPLAYEEDEHEPPHIYKNWEEQKTWCPGPAGLGPWEAHYRAELAAGEPICFCGTPWSQHGTDRYGGYTVTVDCMPPDQREEPHIVHFDPSVSPEEARMEGLYEGGMQNTPTPSHMGFPLRLPYTEAPTTDLGAITTEVQGFAAGAAPRAIGADRQGHTGWWAGLWGRARA